MEIEIKLSGGDDKNPEARKSVTVETHTKRGDIYVVQKSDTLIEGSSTKMKVAGGSRLVITVPDGDNEIVYDSAQGAAVRKGSQVNDGGKPDAPVGALPHPTNTAPFEAKPVQINPIPVAASQQSMAGRPVGEKPPLPGSPVGSPPAGNEGKK